MAATDWPVPIGEASVTTGEWIEVRAPYDGALLGRVPACGPEQVDEAVRAAKAALDAGPLAAWKRAEILDTRRAAARASAPTTSRAIIATEAAKPIKTARVEAQRAVSTFTFAAVAARTLAGEMVPDGRERGGRGQARVHAARSRSVWSARSARSTSRSTSSRTSSRPRSRPAARSC